MQYDLLAPTSDVTTMDRSPTQDSDVIEEVYEVPEHNVEVLRSQIDKLNRRARRIGAPEIEMNSQYDRSRRVKRNVPTPLGVVRINRVFDIYKVSIRGKAPSLKGWRFAATLTVEEGGVILSTAPSAPDLPTHFRDPDHAYECDHCGHRRKRTITYILYHAEKGLFRRVGSTCIKDFLGHQDPHKLASWAEILIQLHTIGLASPDEQWSDGTVPTLRWDLQEFLEWSFSIADRLGWVSRGNAGMHSGDATADHAQYLLSEPADLASRDAWARDRKDYEPTEMVRDRVRAALRWARTEWLAEDPESLSDYELNMKVALNGESVSPKTIGLAASLYAAYERHRAKARQRARQADAPPAPEGRCAVTGTIRRIYEKDNGFTVRTVMTVETSEGWVCWGTCPRSIDHAEAGQPVRFRATFEPKEDDPTFAFFKRPTNAEILDDTHSDEQS